MEAIKHGKHVYCEKPLTHSVWEARQVAQAAREAKVATQMGNQGQASEETRRLCELRLGRRHRRRARGAHLDGPAVARACSTSTGRRASTRPKDTPPVPATLDWDLWLGPAPLRPYHPAYLPFKWRGWWDFGTGALGDIGCHAMDPVFRALKLGAPLSVQAASTRVNEETLPARLDGDLPVPGAPGGAAGQQPPRQGPHRRRRRRRRHAALQAGLVRRRVAPAAARRLARRREDGRQWPPARRRQGLHPRQQGLSASRAPKRSATIPKTIPRSADHYQEWIAACKGGTPAGSNFDWAGPLAESVLLGNVALRVQLREDLTLCKLLWDGPG